MVRNDPETSSGVRNPEAVEPAIRSVAAGYFGRAPVTILDRAVHLRRLLVAARSFVDGNERTASNTTATFYAMDGYSPHYGDQIRAVLEGFGRGDGVDVAEVVDRFEGIARPVEAVEDDRIVAAVKRLQEGMRRKRGDALWETGPN